MSTYVRTEDATGRVMAWGTTAFTDSLPAGQTAHTLAGSGVLEGTVATHTVEGAAGSPMHYCKVDSGAVVDMSAGEKTAVDAALLDALEAPMDGFTRARTKSFDLESASNALVIDYSRSDRHCVLAENITSVTAANAPPAGEAQTMRVMFEQAASGGPYTLPATWPFVDLFLGGGAVPVMPTGAGKLLVMTIYNNGKKTVVSFESEG